MPRSNKRTTSRKLFAHGGVYSASRVANRSIEFLLIPLYAHLLGADGYAVIDILGSVAAILTAVMLQGLHGAWFRLRFEMKTPEELRSFETTVIWYLILSCAVFVGALLVFGSPLARWCTPGIPFYPLGLLTALTAAALALVGLYELKLQADQRPLAFAVFGAVRTILTLVTILFLVAVLRRGAPGRIEAGAISAGILAFAAIVVLRPSSPALCSSVLLNRSLSYGLPLVPHNLAGLSNRLIDRLLLNGMLGQAATGVYAMGYRIASVGFVVGLALNQAFRPLFIEAVKRAEGERARGDHAEADRTLRALSQSGLVLVSAIACLLTCVTASAREVLLIMTTSEFAESWRVVAPVAAGLVAWSCYTVFSQSITYDVRRVRLLPVITITAAALNIVVNLALIPRYGIMGAAWATVISNTVMALLAGVFGWISTPLPYRWWRWTLMLTFCMLGLAGLWWLDAKIDVLWVRLALKLPLAAVVVGLTARSADVTVQALRNLRASGEAAA